MSEKPRPTLPRLPLMFFVVCVIITTSSCSPAARQRVAAVATAAASGAGAAAQSSSKLMIFGGMDHKTYLGCLNCSEYASDSVLNQYGTNGSPYSSNSIWNPYSEFGSAYSNYSACNSYASDPPVIVDHNGSFYGRLTLNRYHPQLGAGAKYFGWLSENVCKAAG